MRVAAWGANRQGECGCGFRGAQLPTPSDSGQFGDVVQAVTTYGTSFALTAGGEVLVVGGNGYGQYGDGTISTGRALAGVMPLDQPCKKVTAGGAHYLLLMEDGTARTGGGNPFGTLGNGTTGAGKEQTGSWVPVTPTFPEGLKLRDVFTAASICAAIDYEDRLWTWGSNRRGSIGDGTKEERTVPVHVLDGVETVACGGGGGDALILALMQDGSVMAWGLNNHGQLGLGDTVSRATPTHILEGEDVVELSCSLSHSLARLFDGSVLSWGNNTEGELGYSTPAVNPTPHNMTSAVTEEVAAGLRYSLVKINGRAYACGSGNYNTLGDASEANRPDLGPVPNLAGVEQLSAGEFTAMAVHPAPAPSPVELLPVKEGLNVKWQPGMATHVAYRPVEKGHQEWEGQQLVKDELGCTLSLTSGVAYEVELTGGAQGQIVLEGTPE